jgi:hypothetical protein
MQHRLTIHSSDDEKSQISSPHSSESAQLLDMINNEIVGDSNEQSKIGHDRDKMMRKPSI